MVQKRGPRSSFRKFPAPREKSPAVCLEEMQARAFIERYRRRLTWLLHIPEWEGLYEEGLESLHLPGASQGINLRGRLNALPLTHKYQLLSWVAESFRGHLPTRTALRIAIDWGLNLPPLHTLDVQLSSRVWQTLREDFVLHMGVENRRYQKHQNFLFSKYHPLIEKSVRRVVFDSNRHPDAMQEGALGLLAAIDHISADPENGFSTYAQTWIVRYMRNHLVRERFVVHVPLNLAVKTLSEATPERPKPQAGSTSVGSGSQTRMSAQQAAELLLQAPVFLDAPKVEGQREMDIPDPESVQGADKDTGRDLQHIVRKGLATLTDKQREVIEARFGLATDKGPQTLEAISREIGITHQQVSQREKRALQKLAKCLKPLLAEIYE